MADKFLEYLGKVRYFSGVSNGAATFKVNGDTFDIKRDERTGIVTVTFESKKGAFRPDDVEEIALSIYKRSSYSRDLTFVKQQGEASFAGTTLHFFFEYDPEAEFPSGPRANGRERYDYYLGEIAAIAMQSIAGAVWELEKQAQKLRDEEYARAPRNSDIPNDSF